MHLHAVADDIHRAHTNLSGMPNHPRWLSLLLRRYEEGETALCDCGCGGLCSPNDAQTCPDHHALPEHQHLLADECGHCRTAQHDADAEQWAELCADEDRGVS